MEIETLNKPKTQIMKFKSINDQKRKHTYVAVMYDAVGSKDFYLYFD